MSKARDIADLVSAGGILADGAIATTEITGVTSTSAELNILDGVTSTAAELNILDGVTSTAAELNILDGVTSTAAELNILDGVTSTAAELNALDGITATVTQLNYNDITTLGTVEAAKVVTANSLGAIKIADDGSYSPATDCIVLGAASEFRLFEDNNGSNIVGVDNLGLYTAGSITLYSGTPISIPLETMATFVGDGAVSLSYDNVTKFATTSTGIDVTGTADMDTLSIGGTAVTATAAELNILDGVTATTAELNFVDGVTSNIQTQIDGLGGGAAFTAF